MKIIGIVFFLAALYYFGWFLVSGQTGSLVGFINLLVTGFLFLLLSTSKQPQRPWFVAKRFGFGWGLPTNVKGWIVYAVFFLTMVITVVVMISETQSVSDAVIGLIPTLGLLLATLTAICYKYGEKPEWRWGQKRD